MKIKYLNCTCTLVLIVVLTLVGCNKEIRPKNPSWMIAEGDMIYYASNDGLYQIDQNMKKRQIMNDFRRMFVIKDNYIYYNDKEEMYELWKYGLHDGVKQKILEGCFCYTIVDSNIYFCSSDLKNVYKTDLNGDRRQLVYTTTSFYIITSMQVWGEYIYLLQIIPESEIGCIKCIRIHLETHKKEEFLHLPNFIQEEEDWLYFIDIVLTETYHEEGGVQLEEEHILYKMDRDGSQPIKMLTLDSTSGIVGVVSDWIVYANAEDGNKLYRIKEDGTLKECISEDSIFMLSIQNGQIYYETPDDMQAEKELYRIEVDGSGKTKIY